MGHPGVVDVLDLIADLPEGAGDLQEGQTGLLDGGLQESWFWHGGLDNRSVKVNGMKICS